MEYNCIPVGVADTTESGAITAVVAIAEETNEIGIVQVSHLLDPTDIMLPDISPITADDPGSGCTLCYEPDNDEMVACDECGFWQHTACQDKWDQMFTRVEGRGDLCCYCYNDWPSPNPESGYVQIAEGETLPDSEFGYDHENLPEFGYDQFAEDDQN